MTVYYNENDPKAAEWLRHLMWENQIAMGDVDERSIEDVRPSDLVGYIQCHFFAGIGGWSYALRLAGWPDDQAVWTGSCPCQPFSAAGKGAGFADERHLWPAWFHLIKECHPAITFGEQVARGGGSAWLNLVSADVEAEGFAFAAANLPAAGAGYPHTRERLYWVAAATYDCSGRWERIGGATPPPRAEFTRLVPPALQLTPAAGPYQLSDDGVPGSMGLLRGFGNAIVPQVAAAFIEAYLDVEPK